MSISNLVLPQNRSVPDIPGLPPSPQNPQDWHEWQAQVLQHRVTVAQETSEPWSGRDRARAGQIVLCERSFPYFANTFGGIYEARREDEIISDTEWVDSDSDASLILPEKSPGVVIPFVMYPFQIQVAQILREVMRSKGSDADALFVKSRDMGLSNEVAFWVAHLWLVAKPFQARLLSRKEDLVDRTGDPDSLFWKIDTFLSALPDWLFYHFAPGFDWKKHRMQMRLINPSNMNVISGESTQQNAGRGGRATVIIYDEICFMEKMKAIWGAGRASTNHRIGVSTVSTDFGLDCYNLAHGEDGQSMPRVVELPYYLHPKHTEEWRMQQESRDEREVFAREVLMDWKAGGGEWVFPETHKFEVQNQAYNPADGPVVVALDDGHDDDFAMIWMQLVESTGRIRVFDSYLNNHKPIDYYGALLAGKPVSGFPWADWNDDEFRIMDFQRSLPGFTVCGDPHIRNKDLVTGTSPFDRLWKEWGVVVLTDPLTRGHKELRGLLSTLLPRIDFCDTTGARNVLRALQRLKFKANPYGREVSSEQRNFSHSKESHLASALMYFAANHDVLQLASPSTVGIAYDGEKNG